MSMPRSKGNVKFCYVCAKDVGNVSSLNIHMEKHADHLRFSNMTADYNKTSCKICGNKFVLDKMRNHTQKLHQMTITEYKDKFQQHFYTLEDPIFHRCGICQAILLLDSDSIASHVKKEGTSGHRMTHKEYNQKFMNLAYNTQSKGKIIKPKENQNSEPIGVNSDPANLLPAKSTDSPFKTKGKQATSSRETIPVPPKESDCSRDKEKSLGGVMLDWPSSEAPPEGVEHVKTFDIVSFREFLRFLGNAEEDGPNTSFPTIETILMMDMSSS